MIQSAPQVGFVNLGCRVNRVEIDDIASELESQGIACVEPEQADVVVINTCAVTGEAEAKARKAIRHAASMPRQPYVVATGCVASLFADELSSLGERVIVEPNKAKVGAVVREQLSSIAPDSVAFHIEGLTPTGRTRPGIKIQDGCDRRCTYCIVWKARGAAQSLPYEQVRSRVAEVVATGAQEVVLTGINLGSYRASQAGDPDNLGELLEALLTDTSAGRIRLSSVEPQDIDEKLCATIAGSAGRVAPFLHIPLQAGCDATLERMGRTYTCAEYAERVACARHYLGERLALGCDVIVGFPGETDTEFAQSLAFCEQMRYAKMHIFRYSKRPGTPAAEAPDQVAPPVMAARARQMRELAQRMRLSCAQALIGQEELVLVEASGSGVSSGLFAVTLQGENIEPGSLVSGKVVGVDAQGRLSVSVRNEHSRVSCK